MSLLVRLPLNGSLENRGTADVTVTVNGTTSYTEGRVGQALSCNGSSFWTIVGVTLGAEASITYWGKTSTANKMPWVIVANSNSSLNLYLTSSGYCLNTGDGSNNLFKNDLGNAVTVLTDNQWHHFAVTFGNSEAKLYIDGAYKGKAITFKNPATTSANTIKLAGGFSGGHSYDFNGQICDFRVYDYCLNEAEVRSHLVNGKGLQIWLPLNGDLRQQGLNNATITNVGTTVNDAGKIGKCYSFNGSSNYLYTTQQGFFGNNYTFSAWVYTTSTSATQTVGCIRTTVGSGFSLFLIGGKLRIDPGGNSIQWTTNYTFPANTWFHLTVTYDGTNVKYYINGVFQQSYSTTISSSYFGNTLSFGASQANGSNYGNYLNGRLNDIRIYDYALSEKEVKELAKGLVLHYKLSGAGNENNIANSKIANRSCTSFSYSGNEGTLICPVNSSTWGVGLVINDTSIKWASGQTWLISMEVYTPQSITWNCDINNKPDLDDVSSYTGNDYDITAQRYAYTNGVSSKTLQAGWNKIWFSQTAPTTYGLYNYSTNWGVVTSSLSEPITIKIKNVKGEVIDSGLPILPTPWIPNSADTKYSSMGYNNNIEYDLSGYGNNGTKMADIPSSSDTPRYHSSYAFDGTNYITMPFLSSTALYDELTIAGWIKRTEGLGAHTANVYLGIMAVYIYYNSGSYKLRLSWNHTKPDGTTYSTNTWEPSGVSSVPLNEWIHYAYTFDSGVLKLFINGEEKKTDDRSATGVYVYGRRGYSVGNACEGVLCSDLRIYSTVLSATDIAQLYNEGIQ